MQVEELAMWNRFPMFAILLVALAATVVAEEPKFRAGDGLQFSDSVWFVLRGVDCGQTLKSNNQFHEDAATAGKFVMVCYVVENQGGKTDRIFIHL